MLLADDYAARDRAGDRAWSRRLGARDPDYLPSRDVQMLEYMELLAVFEASNRRMLPQEVRQHASRGAAGAPGHFEGPSRQPALEPPERARQGEKQPLGLQNSPVLGMPLR